MKVKLNPNDKSILRYVDDKKRSRNGIRGKRFWSLLNRKIYGKGLSKNQVDYSLRKLAKLGLIKTEKWDQVHKRVYWK